MESRRISPTDMPALPGCWTWRVAAVQFPSPSSPSNDWQSPWLYALRLTSFDEGYPKQNQKSVPQNSLIIIIIFPSFSSPHQRPQGRAILNQLQMYALSRNVPVDNWRLGCMVSRFNSLALNFWMFTCLEPIF